METSTTLTQFDAFHDLAARLADGCVPTTLRFVADMLELDNLPPEAAAVRDGHLPTPRRVGAPAYLFTLAAGVAP